MAGTHDSARVGVLFDAHRPAQELPAFARRAEAQRYDELWVVEDCFLSGGMTAAVAALAATGALRVGTGLLPAAVRNAAIAAMEIATVASMYPGRFTTAFGHGVEAWMRQIGARPPDRLVALEETVRAVRALLAGERVTTAGAHVRLDGVELERPPSPPPPVLVGTTGERGLALAGRSADGILLPEGSGAEVVRWARGLGDSAETVVYAWLCVGDDAAALDALRPTVQAWRAMGLYPRLTELAGLPADPSAELSAEQLRRIAVAGSPAACAAAVQERWRAGAASVVLMPAAGDPDGQLARFAADVLALLRRPDAATARP